MTDKSIGKDSNINICFIVLHYKNSKDTIECVDSICSCMKQRVKIVVIDNGSKNESYEVLQERYSGRQNIYIIKNEDNLGFAQGNNVGYSFARNTLNPDFIAVSNNDIVIKDSNFDLKIKACYDDTGFYVMGPDIISLVDQGHQNPMETDTRDVCVVKKRMRYFRTLRILNKLNLYDILRSMHRSADTTNRETKIWVKERQNNIQLHGSFIVFSRNYIDKEELAFCPDTFLYREEAILFLNCEKKRYLTVYEPNLCVFHKEDSSLNFTHVEGKDRRDFVFTQLLKSYKVYLNILKALGE